MPDTPGGPKLIVVSGHAAGHIFDLDGDLLVVGRDPANAIAIADASLSRRHCSLSCRENRWTIRDLGSVNGVLINGERTAEILLKDGDHIAIGKTELLFRAPPAAEGEDVADDGASTVSLDIDDALYLGKAGELPELARVQQDLHALVRIGTELATIAERTVLEQRLLDVAFEIVPADAGALIRLDPVTTMPDIAVSRQRAAEGAPLVPSTTIVEEILTKRVAMLTNDATEEAALRRAKSVARARLTSVLAVPLVERDRPIGALYLTTTNAATRFDKLHLEVLTALAGIGSAALGNLTRVESLQGESARLRQQLNITHGLIGKGNAMTRVRDAIARVAPSDLRVLITGETGTGKELVARALHGSSPRRDWPFMAINCATLGEHLLESELFGHERGAFTHAVATKRGKFEVADRGTIFLDEIGELPLPLQAKLLRVLQQQEIERVGGSRTIKVDVRVIAATNRDLKKEVAEKRFRDDLYFRLAAYAIHMPALRDRPEDIPDLAKHFAEIAARRTGGKPIHFSAEAMRRLLSHDWPGNVRELENAVERAAVLCDDAEILPEDLPEGVGRAELQEPGISRVRAVIDEAKRRVISEALAESGGVHNEAARLLGLHPNYLHRLRNSLKLRPPGDRRRKKDDDEH